MALQLRNLAWLGLGKEVTQGTVVNPTLWIPAKAIKPEDLVNYVNDDSLQNNVAKFRNAYPAEQDSTVDFDGLLFPDHIGSFLVAAGLSDVVTGSSSPYTHTFKYNSASSAPSWTATVFNVVETRRYPGLVMDELSMKIDAKGAVSYQTKWKGWPSSASSAPATSFPSSVAFLGYQAQVKVGGAAIGRVTSADFSLKREASTEHTVNNTSSPYASFQGPMDGDLKIKATFENTTDWTHLTSNDQPVVSLIITQPGGGSAPVLTLTGTVTSWQKAAHDFSLKYMGVDIDIKHVFSSTDGGPLQASLVNAVAAAY